VKVIAESKNKGHAYASSTECEYAQEAKSKVWFPSRVVHQRTVDGRVEFDETVNVTVLSLNDPLDADVFKIKGMEIPPGTAVLDFLKSDGKGATKGIWDGKEVVPAGKKRVASLLEAVPEISRPARQWWLYGYAVLFALMGAAVLYRFRRKAAVASIQRREGEEHTHTS